jgi:1-acyl-sn-glycerol-3-phosphate acyltransferase
VKSVHSRNVPSSLVEIDFDDHVFRQCVAALTCRQVFRAVLASRYLIKVHNYEGIPRQGPMIVAINHTHRLDMLVLLAALPIALRPVMASDVIRGHPILSAIIRFAAKWLGAIVVDRTGVVKPSSIKALLGALASGESVAIAPEGRRGRPGALLEGRRGAAFLARRAGVRVLPVAIDGYRRIEGRKRVINVTVGDIFELGDRGSALPRAVLEADTMEIMNALGSLLGLKASPMLALDVA